MNIDEKDAMEFVIPWGKNKGLRFIDLTTRSIRWYAENARDEAVREHARVALGWAKNHDPAYDPQFNDCGEDPHG